MLRDHTGSWSYRATAPAGIAYPDGQIDTGDPLYLDLVERVELIFELALTLGVSAAALAT